MTSLEQDTVSVRFQLRGEQDVAGIAVVAVDDVTFSDLERQWPFKRSLHAKAVDALRRAGAREIVYDVQFTEPTKPAEDRALYDAIGRAGGAVLATTETDGHGRTKVLGGDDNLAAVGAVAGAANLVTDARDIIHRFPYASGGLDSLAVVAARRAGRPLDRSAFEAAGAWIDYRGPAGTIPTVSFSDLVRGRADTSLLRDRIVVVGATAPTLQDVHATPTSPDRLMSGPEIQANAIWTALHGLPLRSAPRLLGWLAILVLGLLPALATMRGRAAGAALAAPLLAFSYLLARPRRLRLRARPARHLSAPRAPARNGERHRRRVRGRARAAPARRLLQRASRGRGPRAHRGTARHTARDRAPPRSGRRASRRRHRGSHRPHEHAVRPPRTGRRPEPGRGRPAPARGGAARRRQGRHPRPHPAQARPSRARRAHGDGNAHHRRGRAASPARDRRWFSSPSRSPGRTTSAGTAPGTRTASAATRSRSPPASAPSATSSTRCSPRARTRRRGRSSRHSRSSGRSAAATSTPSWSTSSWPSSASSSRRCSPRAARRRRSACWISPSPSPLPSRPWSRPRSRRQARCPGARCTR